MKADKIEVKNIVIGVVYRYYTPDGKSYVGCTTNERKRKEAWNWKNNPYGGRKIAAARNDFGLSAFKYEVLRTIIDTDKGALVKRLERWEMYFIKRFDSFSNGYNTNKGGRGKLGIKLSEMQKAKIRMSSKKKAVRAISVDGSREIIFESMMETSRWLKKSVGIVYYYLNKAKTKSINGYKLQLVA